MSATNRFEEFISITEGDYQQNEHQNVFYKRLTSNQNQIQLEAIACGAFIGALLDLVV